MATWRATVPAQTRTRTPTGATPPVPDPDLPNALAPPKASACVRAHEADRPPASALRLRVAALARLTRADLATDPGLHAARSQQREGPVDGVRRQQRQHAHALVVRALQLGLLDRAQASDQPEHGMRRPG